MQSDDSEEDDYNLDEEDEEDALRYILNADDGNLRGYQMLRGQLDTTKRVATKKALRELQSVQISDLPEKERTCVICYNDFGVESPEGINEQPLRLPRCKHVFGDHCIKKWFKESDSCPYCRDKLPSEIAIPFGAAAMHDMIRRERRATMAARNQYAQRWVCCVCVCNDEFGLLIRDLAPFSALHYPPRGMGGPSQAAPTSFERGTATNASRSDNSPPRSAWPQTGDRRSPPSEASDNSRRTRPRHG
ncbi:hypothetical protein QBC42DRAFT_184228, partial [Cladorrhinum samala]